MLITTDWLRAKGACAPKVALFEKVFGSEVELTRESIMRAAETNQSPRWLAEMVLDSNKFEIFKDHLKEDEDVRASLMPPVRKDKDYTGKAIEADRTLRIAEASALADMLEL